MWKREEKANFETVDREENCDYDSALKQGLPESRGLRFFPILGPGKLNPQPAIADSWSVGPVAKWLRQRIANPSSSVRLRPGPLF